MAELASETALGGAVNDTVGQLRIARVVADGSYVLVPDFASQSAAREITADPAPATEGAYVASGGAYAITLGPLAGYNIGDKIEITNVDGGAKTITPAAGEILNGEVDGTFFSDTQRQRVVVEKVSATEWQVGLSSSFGGTSARLGEFFFARSGRTEMGLLAVSPGTVTNGAALYPKWAAMYPEFVSGANIVFPADVEGMFLRNLGGNAAVEGTSQADGTAVNGLRALRTYVQSDWNGQSNNDFSKGSGSPTGTVNNGVGMSSSDPETRPANRAYQLYTIVDGYGDSYAAGTLLAEPVEDLLAGGFVDDNASLDWSAADLTPYEHVRIVTEARSAGGQKYSYSHTIRVADLPNSTFWHGDGTNTFAMGVNAAGTSGQMQYAGTVFTIAGEQKIYGIRKQFNAIRAEDAALSTDHVEVTLTVATSPDTFTTQGIYKGNGTFTLPGAPVGNFVWSVDVDVFGSHIKQTLLPRDAGTTVLGHHVRRSFDGGGTWTAWAGH